MSIQIQYATVSNYSKNSGSDTVWIVALRKADLAATLRETTRNVIKYMCLLSTHPDSIKADSWKSQIYKLLHKVPKRSNSKKYPSMRFLLKHTINAMYSDIEYLAYVAVSNYRDRQMQEYELSQGTEKMKNNIVAYFEWLAKNLSVYGEVTRPDVYTMLECLRAKE